MGAIRRRQADPVLTASTQANEEFMITKKKLRQFAVVLATAVGLGLVVGPMTAKAADKVVFTSAINVPFAPTIIAVEMGFARKHGLDAEYKIFDSGAASVEAVVTKNAQVAICADLCLMILHAKGGHFNLVARTGYTGTELGIGARADIKKPADLVGKKIGYFKISPGEQYLDLYFKKYGLDAKAVQLIHIAPPEWIPAMARGDIDAFFGWEPWLTKLPTIVRDAHILARSGDGNVYTMEFGLVMDKAFISDKPAVAERALEAIKDAVDYINAHRKEAAAIVAKAYHISPSDAESYMANNTYVLDFNKSFVDRQRSIARWVDDHKIAQIPDITAAINGYVDSRLIKKVMPRNTDL
jgi:ABC-type nitrate/sulfonate/bicarbonate transport system substrate-binding protein